MGGQLIKGYSIQGEAIGSAGLMKTWKLFKSHKSGAQVNASIFLIEKRNLKKAEKDEVIRVAKKESSSLLRVRHPGVLAVIEPLTEDQNILAFVTERIEGNLSQLIKHNKIQDSITSELQLKLFLYPFIETVNFIHDNLKQAHLALSFDNIYVNAEGKWKIAGFGYNQTLNGDDLINIEQKISELTFSAPEVALNKQFTKKTDIFSIGLIVINLLQVLYKSYKPLTITEKNDYEKTFGYLKSSAAIPIISKTKNPVELQQLLKNVLSWEPNQRYNLNQILQSAWMNDSTLITVKYLDKISSYQNKQQLQFLKGLAGVLDDFELRVIIKIIVPKLLDLLKFNHLIASIVYIVIDLLKKNKLTNEQFKKTVWPALKAVTQGKQITAQAIYLIVFNLETLEKFIGEPDTTTYILPLYIKCYECPQKLKHLALTMLEKLSKKIDYQFLKNKILPKLTLLFKDQNIEIRKDALRALYSIINQVDSQTLSLVILPGLESARKMGSDPMINAIINKMYNMMTESLSIEVISSKILPVLIPYLTEPSINRTEFSQFKTTIVRMIEKIEKQREKTFQNNPLSNENINFDEADFKFKEEELKAPEEKKGNYNFLANYRQYAPQNNNTQEPTGNVETQLPYSNSNPINQMQINQTPNYQSNIQIKANKPAAEKTNSFEFNSSAFDNMGFNFSNEQKNTDTFDFGIPKTQEKFSLPQGMNIKEMSKNDNQKQKKFLGPTSSPKKEINNEISLDLNYFNSNTSTIPSNNNNNFNLSFNTSEIQIQQPKQIKPIAKPNFAGMSKKEPTFQFNLGSNLSTNYGNLGSGFGNSMATIVGGTMGNSFGSNLNSNDPFAEIEMGYGIQPTLPQINLNLNSGLGQPPKVLTPTSFGNFEGGFNEVKPKNLAAPKNNFQLI